MFPLGLVVSAGHLYVVEMFRVQELSLTGGYIRTFDEAGSGTGRASFPYGIAADPKTHDLYVSEVGNDRVQEFSPEGAFIAAFGSAGSGGGQLSGPLGLGVDPSGGVFVADTGNNRVRGVEQRLDGNAMRARLWIGAFSALVLALPANAQAKLVPAGELGKGDFGHSVAISADGDSALVGGWFDDGETGAAWVFARSGTSWIEQRS